METSIHRQVQEDLNLRSITVQKTFAFNSSKSESRPVVSHLSTSRYFSICRMQKVRFPDIKRVSCFVGS